GQFGGQTKKLKKCRFLSYYITWGRKCRGHFFDHFASLITGKNIPPFPCNFNFLGNIYCDSIYIIIHALPHFLIRSLQQVSRLCQIYFLSLSFFLFLQHPLLPLLFFLQFLFQLFLIANELPFFLQKIFLAEFTFTVLFIPYTSML